jgi:hypothetical protein
VCLEGVCSVYKMVYIHVYTGGVRGVYAGVNYGNAGV